MIKGTRAIFFVAVMLLSVRSGFSQSDRKTIWSGVFNEEQLARGAKAYNGTCARCQLEDLSGKNGPTLKGDRFMEDWREATKQAAGQARMVLLRLAGDGGLLHQIETGQWDNRLSDESVEIREILDAMRERARLDRIILDKLAP